MTPADAAPALLRDDRAWTKSDVARFLQVSVRTVDSLPIPRACIRGIGSGRGSVRYVPAVVREWLNRQSSPQLPPSV
jgi:hypothetical protein